MNHHELGQLSGPPLGLESEEQTEFRRERAKRLLGLARQHGGPERLAGITLEQLAVMAPGFAVARLGLPSSVLLDGIFADYGPLNLCPLGTCLTADPPAVLSSARTDSRLAS